MYGAKWKDFQGILFTYILLGSIRLCLLSSGKYPEDIHSSVTDLILPPSSLPLYIYLSSDETTFYFVMNCSCLSPEEFKTEFISLFTKLPPLSI